MCVGVAGGSGLVKGGVEGAGGSLLAVGGAVRIGPGGWARG